MTFDDYQQQALKTEAPITDEVRTRFNECQGLLFDLMLEDIPISWADYIKKYIFYGEFDDDLVTEIKTSKIANPPLPDDDRTIRLVHGWLGMASEVPELVDAIYNQDFANIAEESGDFRWYSAVIDDACELPSNVVAAANIRKLATRYPEKFSEEKAINRNLIQENAVLSDALLTE